MTLDTPDKGAFRIVVSVGLGVGVEMMAIHFNVEAALFTLRANLYLSALDSGSQGKNCIVRDQCLPFPNI